MSLYPARDPPECQQRKQKFLSLGLTERKLCHAQNQKQFQGDTPVIYTSPGMSEINDIFHRTEKTLLVHAIRLKSGPLGTGSGCYCRHWGKQASNNLCTPYGAYGEQKTDGNLRIMGHVEQGSLGAEISGAVEAESLAGKGNLYAFKRFADSDHIIPVLLEISFHHFNCLWNCWKMKCCSLNHC
jgi:hypothetical protein